MGPINDRTVLSIRLSDMSEGPAKQAVQFFRYEKRDRSLDRALCIPKERFGRPELIKEAQERNLKEGRPIKDNFESLSDFFNGFIEL